MCMRESALMCLSLHVCVCVCESIITRCACVRVRVCVSACVRVCMPGGKRGVEKKFLKSGRKRVLRFARKKE